jgi:hypothetical protein
MSSPPFGRDSDLSDAIELTGFERTSTEGGSCFFLAAGKKEVSVLIGIVFFFESIVLFA